MNKSSFEETLVIKILNYIHKHKIMFLSNLLKDLRISGDLAQELINYLTEKGYLKVIICNTTSCSNCPFSKLCQYRLNVKKATKAYTLTEKGKKVLAKTV